MVGIINRFKAKQREFEKKQNVHRANKLAGLREERIRQEGIVKVNTAYAKEKSRIKTAKQQRFKQSFEGKVVKGVGKRVVRHKARRKRLSSKRNLFR